ncbi:MAG: anthranilate synthase component I [Methylococcales bacterium]|nr:anthranilate synthase component I [Methylococcales bacterium]MBT7409755.1 anthranilate synthase component I [Methylococcales bacterium]
MNIEVFNKLVEQGYNRIPLIKEVLADLDTPLSSYLKLANGDYSYLFESVSGGEKWGRYSIIGLPCKTTIHINNSQITIKSDVSTEQLTDDDPLSWIEKYSQQYKVPEVEGIPKFTGGLVGYFGYETIRYIEPKLFNIDKKDLLNTPEILLMVSDEVIVFDNFSGKIFFVVHANTDNDDCYNKAQQRLDELLEQLKTNIIKCNDDQAKNTITEADFKSEFQQEAYEESVRKIKQYIVDGDVMQVVLSQRMSIPYKSPPINLYRALRCLNPSPYMYYLNLKDFYIVGSSPEILTRVEEEEITVRPIAGTRPRGKTPQQDLDLEKELLDDPKECAEHLMLIDLGRNDVGRVVQTGSVEVTEKMLVERYSHVMHIVSNVVGKMQKNVSIMDALKATFPAGTVSGAPKIRAMEIIEELETVKRGIYSGAVGYISWEGNMDTAIAIRTAVIKDQTLYIQAGAGIVADSDPTSEWQETMNKGRAIFRAAAMAENGLEQNSDK